MDPEEEVYQSDPMKKVKTMLKVGQNEEEDEDEINQVQKTNFKMILIWILKTKS